MAYLDPNDAKFLSQIDLPQEHLDMIEKHWRENPPKKTKTAARLFSMLLGWLMLPTVLGVLIAGTQTETMEPWVNVAVVALWLLMALLVVFMGVMSIAAISSEEVEGWDKRIAGVLSRPMLGHLKPKSTAKVIYIRLVWIATAVVLAMQSFFFTSFVVVVLMVIIWIWSHFQKGMVLGAVESLYKDYLEREEG